MVAAFFACQPVSVWVGNTNPPSDDGIIHAIKSEGSDYITEAETKRIFSLKSVRLVAPSYVADRVAAQRGFFTLHPKPNLAWNPISEGFKTKTFVVESKYKDYFVKRLFYVGVDNFALFKGLDGLGRQIKWQLDRGVELWRPI